MKKTQTNNSFGRLVKCVDGYWWATILCPLAIVAEVILEVMIPKYMADIVNSLQSTIPPTIDSIALMGAKMVGVAVCSLIAGMLAARFASVAGIGFAMNLRKKVFYKIQDFSFLNIDKFQTASLVTRCTTDITNVQNTFMQIIRMMVRSPLMFIMATIMAFKLHAELALIFVIAVPILAVVMFTLSRFAFPRFGAMLKTLDKMNGGVQENLIGIRVVKSFVREDYEKDNFNQKASAVMNAQIKAERLMVLLMPTMQLVMYASKLAIVGWGGSFVVGGTLLIGDLSAMITYAIQILNSLLMLGMVSVTFVISKASLTRINQVLDEELDIKGVDSDLTVDDGSVDFDDVNFSYGKDNTNYVLSDVNLKINSGETVGVIGGTGEGKSTLVQLIPRLYDASCGSVKVGGHDVKEYSLRHLRDSVSMVLQKNVLFSGTIKENLKWGNPEATDEQIIDACQQAQAHDFIMSFPNGYDTDLGQGGVNVSGGQKQRLCIARAVLKQPKILILDDSTSAVDTNTDEKIRNALSKTMQHTTKIIIAQRIQSIFKADKIVVIDKGRIVDVGNHDELIKRCEIYQEVYYTQNSKEVA